jgi:hypothetical protein
LRYTESASSHCTVQLHYNIIIIVIVHSAVSKPRSPRASHIAVCGHSDHRYALACPWRKRKTAWKNAAQETEHPTRHRHRGRQAPLQINAFACVSPGGRTPLRTAGNVCFFYTTQRALGYFYSWGMWANRTPAHCVRLLIRSRVLHCACHAGQWPFSKSPWR